MGLRTAITLSAGMLLLAGCTADPGAPARAATYESAACPDDVEVMLVAAHTCGYVVIPRDTGPDLRIFALSVDPPGKPFGGPILETGTDLGMTPSYSGLAPIAERTGRRVVIVDLPGTGHSTPSLNCPEVDALPARTATATEVARAVGSCRARLAAAGVPTSDFTVSALGSDLHDIISALGGRGWVVMAHGTSGRAAATLAAEHPEQVAALALSSPTYRDETPVRPIVADVARRCAANRGCTARYGDPLRNWTEAIGRARRAPLRIRMQQQTLVMDADHVVAAVRWLVAPAVRGAGQLPALLAELASRRPGTELELYAATALAAPPLRGLPTPVRDGQHDRDRGGTLQPVSRCRRRASVAARVRSVGRGGRHPPAGSGAQRADARPDRPLRPLRGSHDIARRPGSTGSSRLRGRGPERWTQRAGR